MEKNSNVLRNGNVDKLLSKYLVSVSYDGSSFFGWAKQPKVFTVQEFIERKIIKCFSLKEKFSIFGISRTDKGVHAKDQKFIFSISNFSIEISKIKNIIQKSFGNFVRVKKIEKIDNCFNLKKVVRFKEYRYFIKLKNFTVFDRNYFLDLSSKEIDIIKFQKTLSVFEGFHDFFNFSSVKINDKSKKNTFREIKSIKIKKENDEIIYISFISKGFLRYQIRAIIGESLDKHLDENGISTLKRMLSCISHEKYKKIASPCGLYLWKIDFF